MQSGLPLAVVSILGIVCVVGFNVCIYLLLSAKHQKELLAKNKQLEETLEKANILANTDSLTGLFNRRYMAERFSEQIEYAEKSGNPFSIIICDIDGFKRINDSFGHDIGDKVLSIISSFFKESCRGKDIISRWGGEEFLFLLPKTNIEESVKVAERLRNDIQELDYGLCDDLIITMTFGVSTYSSGAKIDSIIKSADTALLFGKENGKNRVEMYQE